MKITRDEAGLLLAAIETRCRALREVIEHPVLVTCVDEALSRKICGEMESLMRVKRKVALADKAMLAREGK